MDLEPDFDMLADETMQDTAISRVFTKQEAAQGGSRLLRLPAEVRQVILKYCLIRDEGYISFMMPILGSDLGAPLTDGIDEIIGYSYGLTPQVLTTCQTLLREGWLLLYTQNTLGMMFVARDNTITEPSQEVVCSLYIGDYVLGQEQYYDHTFKEIDSLIYRAFSHFSTIRLKLMFVGHHSERTWGVHQQLEALLRRYRRLLNHKSIHAEFDCILPEGYAAFIQTPDLKGFAPLLQPLRCTQFTYKADQSSLWKPIADLVTSDKQPVDLPRAFLKLSELWDKFQINSGDYEDANTILSEAEDAVNEFDVDTFVKKRAELIRLQRRMLGQSVDELYGHDNPKLRRLCILHELETLRHELGENEDLST